MRRLGLILCCVLGSSGCTFLPEISRQPVFHNPFPQLTKVAIAPFFNHSTEKTVDGRQFALAYFNELQSIPGFEVVPVGIVEQHMRAYGITLATPLEARKLAQLLEVDAVVVGAVTDFTPYYPPRVGLQVEWYAANPGFHPIPPGYGLPWGTPDEELIPPPLIFEARMALAREQMKTQEPAYRPLPVLQPVPQIVPPVQTVPTLPPAEESVQKDKPVVQTAASQPLPVAAVPIATPVASAPGLPPDWPDPRGFTPPPPSATRPIGVESMDPVLRHAKTYSGNNADVTEALSTYVHFRDDARFGGWQAYLQRSDDFIRFCCHMHITEMLTARGGAGETRVVWRWPTGR
jgi:hypothetical protein